MGIVPGQMARMGKPAKEEANGKRKERYRCGGGGEHRPSPQPCFEEGVRLRGRGGGSKIKEAAAPSEKKEHWGFVSPGRRGPRRSTYPQQHEHILM
jgi:hypothetical protein